MLQTNVLTTPKMHGILSLMFLIWDGKKRGGFITEVTGTSSVTANFPKLIYRTTTTKEKNDLFLGTLTALVGWTAECFSQCWKLPPKTSSVVNHAHTLNFQHILPQCVWQYFHFSKINQNLWPKPVSCTQ